jgi:hypothetical protein
MGLWSRPEPGPTSLTQEISSDLVTTVALYSLLHFMFTSCRIEWEVYPIFQTNQFSG